MAANERILQGNQGPVVHPLRQALINELHARPFEVIHAPACVVHFSLLTREVALADEIDHLNRLCDERGIPRIANDSNHSVLDFGDFRLTWERHTEFSSYTFILAQGNVCQPFAESPYHLLPQAWCTALHGSLINAVRIVLLGKDSLEPDAATLAAVMSERDLIGALASGGKARYWTDFRPAEDGFVRVLIQDLALSPRATGRLVRRLLELQSYSLLALLGLPVSRTIQPDIGRFEAHLSQLVTAQGPETPPQDEQRLLGELTDMAAQVEQLLASHTYRFGATRAYHDIVLTRLRMLREMRIEGLMMMEEFIDRRLAPAMQTTDIMHRRLASLAQRVARASELLRTRIDVTLAAQNRDLLASMNRRAKLQLQLQQTVEGLSVVAITYYASSVIEHLAHGLEAAGLHVNPALWGGLSIPLVAVAAFWGLRRMHRSLGERKG